VAQHSRAKSENLTCERLIAINSVGPVHQRHWIATARGEIRADLFRSGGNLRLTWAFFFASANHSRGRISSGDKSRPEASLSDRGRKRVSDAPMRRARPIAQRKIARTTRRHGSDPSSFFRSDLRPFLFDSTVVAPRPSSRKCNDVALIISVHALHQSRRLAVEHRNASRTERGVLFGEQWRRATRPAIC
jgi:hypothetical protein